jgi:hypothetical protein
MLRVVDTSTTGSSAQTDNGASPKTWQVAMVVIVIIVLAGIVIAGIMYPC